MTTERTLRLVSWNICGLKSPRTKCHKLLKELADLNTCLALLQETRIGPDDKGILENLPGWKSYFTVYNPKSRGVAILIKNDLRFKYICHDEDCSGGYVVLFCQINGHTFTLVNVYKHKSETEMLIRLAQYLQQTACGTLVIGGDFNGVLNPLRDRKNPCKTFKPDHQLSHFTSSLAVHDVWPLFHNDRGFTYTQNDSSSRIDIFFMLKRHLEFVESIEIQERSISDHQPLVLKLRIPEKKPEPLQDTIGKVSKMLKEYDRIRPCFYKRRKLSGSAIFTAINELSLDCKETLIEPVIEKYKNNALQNTEELKIYFNQSVRMKTIPDRIKCKCSHNTSSHSSADHLIYSRVLRKYLKFNDAKHCRGSKGTLRLSFRLDLANKIKMKFLKRMLKSCHRFVRMIPKLLPDHCKSSKYKSLMADCPLTEAVLAQALQYLGDQMTEVAHRVTQNGLTLQVCGHENNELMIRTLHLTFKRKSGLAFIKSYQHY